MTLLDVIFLKIRTHEALTLFYPKAIINHVFLLTTGEANEVQR